MEPLKDLRDCDIWVLLDGRQYCTPDFDAEAKNEPVFAYVALLHYVD